jgi:selenide,water dikinase
LRGGSDVARAAGVPTLGGHSIDDAEPKYGLVAIGEVHPDRVVTNAAARAGDVLVLTKPLGSGVVATAIKSGAAAERTVATAIEVMATLNRAAAEAMLDAGVVAATDVTGFGLLGHLHRMLLASGVAATIRAADVPLLPAARELAAAGHVPGGTKRNLEDLFDRVDFADTIDVVARTLLADAQTSGGLLMCVPEARVAPLVERLAATEHAAAVIGRVVEGTAGKVRVE